MVRILKHENTVAFGRAGLDLWIGARCSHPETPLRVPVHLDGLIEQRILRPERDLVPALHVELRQGQGSDAFLRGHDRSAWIRCSLSEWSSSGSSRRRRAAFQLVDL